MRRPKKDIQLTSYDELLGLEETPEKSMNQVVEIDLAKLYPFKNHPFHVNDDEKMAETVESIKTYGVLTPALVRPRPDGGYEMISGHRRKRGCELCGKTTLPALVRNYTDDEAVIIMVDSNIQRENLLPSEKTHAYKMKYDAMKHQGSKGHSIGCSDVLVITDEGKTAAYYINKDGFIIVPEFLTIKSSSDTRLSIDTTGYEIEGKEGTWLAQDYILMNEKKWFLMEHEEYGTRAAYVILSEDGAVVMNDCYNGFDEEARRNIQNFMQQQAAKEQEQQVHSQMQPNQIQQSPEQQKKKPELANWQKVMDNGEYLRSAEMVEEVNYNMIDGLMNNTPKKKDKNASRRSVLKRLRKHQQKIAS